MSVLGLEVPAKRDVRKRVLLQMRNGIHRFVGVFDPSVHQVRDFVEFDLQRGFVIDKTQATLEKVTHRYILYREVHVPQPKGR